MAKKNLILLITILISILSCQDNSEFKIINDKTYQLYQVFQKNNKITRSANDFINSGFQSTVEIPIGELVTFIIRISRINDQTVDFSWSGSVGSFDDKMISTTADYTECSIRWSSDIPYEGAVITVVIADAVGTLATYEFLPVLVYEGSVPKLALPRFSPGFGEYESAQNIAISSITFGASFRYTIDGSNPKTSLTAVEGNQITVEQTLTVKAYACKEGYLDSDIIAGDYIIIPADNTSADLSNLIVSPCGVTPAFRPDLTSYTAEVEQEITGVTVVPFTTDEQAHIVNVKLNNQDIACTGIYDCSPLNIGYNLLTVCIRAGNDINEKVYEVEIIRRKKTGPQEIIYVNAASTAAIPDGLSWETAFNDIGQALELAYDTAESLGKCQLWIAGGTYYIYRNSADDTVLLKKGIELYGGFAGYESGPDQRNRMANPTIFNGENRIYHVITGSNEAVLDGLTITGGNAVLAGSTSKNGGGLLNVEAAPGVINCAFKNNTAAKGGAIYYNDADIVLTKCSFSENQADEGGAVAVENSSWANIVDCQFNNNHAHSRGGALHLYNGTYNVTAADMTGNDAAAGGAINIDRSTARINNSYINNNKSLSNLFGGGAVFSLNSNTMLTNIVFFSNQTAGNGGAVNYRTSVGEVTNCSFYDNKADGKGGAISNLEMSNLSIRNSILYKNDDDISSNTVSLTDVSYSNITRGFSGTGNIGKNPKFADQDNGNLALRYNSPCIDAAHGDYAPPTDITGYERVDDEKAANTGRGTPDYVDMGAYEYH